jgi:antitoxin FitA
MSTTLTIRNLDPDVKRKLRLRAALHQHSMEAEVRAILSESVRRSDPSPNPPSIEERARQLLHQATGVPPGPATTEYLRILSRRASTTSPGQMTESPNHRPC